jgi:membrane protein implicated in regulation of membrane protease activity
MWFWIWVVLTALLAVGEMLTASFFVLPFAIGTAAAALVAFFGGPLWLQWLLFVVVSAIALIAFRPLAKKLTEKAEPDKSGVDRLIGLTGVILEGTTPAGSMQARVDHEIWTVTTESDRRFPADTPVRVLSVDGTHLVVEEA